MNDTVLTVPFLMRKSLVVVIITSVPSIVFGIAVDIIHMIRRLTISSIALFRRGGKGTSGGPPRL